jgi:hypothetical protein
MRMRNKGTISKWKKSNLSTLVNGDGGVFQKAARLGNGFI